MLTPEEIKHLQTLSCISLDQEEEKTLGKQLVGIVDFLGKLNEIKIDQDILDGTAGDTFDHFLSVVPDVCQYEDANALFQNVQHEKINNSIVIKSVIEN